MLTLLLSTTLLTPVGVAADPGPWQAVLTEHVDNVGNVDYAAIKASGALDGYLDGLAKAAAPTERAAQLAFWMNAYNALTVDLIADNWPLASIRDLDGGDPWNQRTFTVAGKAVTLNAIEHEILRPLGDPRIHAGVNCASRGCPPLHPTAFTPENVDAELTAASARWVATTGVRVDARAGVVKLNQIFDWYGDDFLALAVTDLPGVEGKQEAALSFLLPHLSAADAEYLRKGGYTVEWRPYSWKVNAR